MARKHFSRERKLNSSELTEVQENFIDKAIEKEEKVVVERTRSNWFNGGIEREEY